ncbi:MAG: ABC-2 type transport system permease protein [Sphingobacteriales bacterium]|jgi:ABC-2 type transport system permease protein
MFFNILSFELRYRFKRPATWIYFGIMFLLAFGASSSDVISIGGGTGNVRQNAPVVLQQMMLILSAFCMMITSAIMGVAVLRDFEHKTESILFTTPISKGAYLWGRFVGSFIVVLFVFTGMLLGFMIGPTMPWVDSAKLLPFNLYFYLHPFVAFVIPSLFFTGSIFFAAGALSRKMLVVYTQGALLLVGYLVSNQFISDLDNQTIAALIDPFALGTSGIETRYWTVAEQNSQVVSLTGNVLYNRLLWIGLGLFTLILTQVRFKFTTETTSWFSRKQKASSGKSEKANTDINIPTASYSHTFGAQFSKMMGLSRFYFKNVMGSVPFIAIVIAGIGLIFASSGNFNRSYGTYAIPTTYSLIELIGTFNLFFLIIIIFYGGELIWRERDVKINLIYDALPFPNWVSLGAKFLGMIYIHIVLLFVLIGAGMLIQTFKGYYNYEIGVYIKTLFTDTFSFLVLYTILTFFVQVMVNHKFLAHATIVVFFIAMAVMDTLGFEHSMFSFGSGSMGTYSDMNSFGHFPIAFSWYSIYWFGFAIALFVASIILSARGSEAIMKIRMKVGKLNLTKPMLTFAFSGLIMFAASGCFIYYNTNVLNEYQNSEDSKTVQAKYEKTLKVYKNIPQPRIIGTYLNVELYPRKRDFTAEGYYLLKNKTNAPIKEIHIQQSSDDQMKVTDLKFDRDFELAMRYDSFKYEIYALNLPLEPGDSLKMDFKAAFTTTGFKEGGGNTGIVYNGTFFNNAVLPSFGYNDGLELSQDDDRKDHDLPEKERMMAQDDSIGLHQNLFGDDGDFIDFEIIIGTQNGQTAIAPGYLEKSWEENNRAYFHYKMDKPMVNFYSILSGNYETITDKWTSEVDSGKRVVNLEIYFHKDHTYNLDRMMKGMKKSLSYYEKNFGPYQFRQMRILEFPRYASFAQSFANTVPYSESIGFILDIKEDDVDMVFYVTAHEMAHQWWGHQVTDAGVQGNAMLSETMSQYSALMVMKESYSPEMMQKFLKYELDSYLGGRSNETKKEQPLYLVEGQAYIHYRKGSLVMYALQDYIGEDKVNEAFRNFRAEWMGREDLYPTSSDLLKHIKAVTPDSMMYFITDQFETITLYENRTVTAEAKESSNRGYQVTIDVMAKKYRADSLGNETNLVLNDWVDIGVYGENARGKDSLLYLKKHKIVDGEQSFLINVGQLPTKAGIDPINKLIDRNSSDNTKKITLIGDES